MNNAIVSEVTLAEKWTLHFFHFENIIIFVHVYVNKCAMVI